jgi:branched-chain amino acid transport system substrate-binding protein
MKDWRISPWIFWGAILFLTLSLVPAFAGEQSKGALKLYTSWPLQGAMIPDGTAMKRAVDLAIEHAVGMAAGYKVVVVNLDDASPVTGSWDGTVEAENAQKAIADADAMVYIGPYNSGAAKVSMPITNKAGMAQVTVANTYPGLTKPGNAPGEPGIYRPAGNVNYFRPFPSDDIQGAAAAKLAQCLGFKRVFILDDRQLYGKGIADVFEKTAKELGLQVVGHEGLESVDIDFRALLTKVKAANADLIYGGFVIDSGGPQVIQQMKALGLFDAGAKFMGPDGLYSPALVEQATPTAVNNNVYVTFAGLPPDQLPTEMGKRFYTDYKAKYKDEPIGWAMYAYQATLVTVDAIKRAGAKDRAKILDALRNTKNFEGITGRFSFDDNGDTDRTDMGGFQVKDHKFQFVGLISKDKCP